MSAHVNTDGTGTVLRFELLGTLRVLRDGHEIPLRSHLQRTLLARLLLAGGHGVPQDDLIDTLWPEDPPETSVALLYTHSARLRALLKADGLLPRSARGYRIELTGHGCDIEEFRAVARFARSAGTPPRQALTAACAGLTRWRGPALADLPGPLRSSPPVRALAEERRGLAVFCAETAQRLGVLTEVVGLLARTADDSPYDEPLHAWLLRGLAAQGRVSEALGRYAVLQRRLYEELGTDPAVELRGVHQELLRLGDQRHAVAITSGPAAAGAQESFGGRGRPDVTDLAGPVWPGPLTAR